MTRIVMFEGGVETLAYFSYQMADQFQQMGYAVFFYDLKDEERSAKKLRKFIRLGETVLVTFNFQGLEKEKGIYKKENGYIWDSYRIPCYNIAADHPYFYHDRLKDLPANYHHVSIDRKQEVYFKRFYPEFRHEGFLPLAGSGIACAEGMQCQKKYDVVFTGNYTNLSFFEPYINRINDEYATFYRGIIEELILKPYQTVEEVALKHCEREIGKVSDDKLRVVLSNMIFIDLYVRNYWREKVVRTLVNAGICVDVVGKGWETLSEIKDTEKLRIHPQTDSLTCLKLIQESRVSLNVMPWFKDGAHDRVFNSILNDAVCLSDTSKYLCEELEEGEGVCYYQLQHLEELPDKMKDLLHDKKRVQDITAKGRVKVLEKHTWKKRAEQIVQWFEA